LTPTGGVIDPATAMQRMAYHPASAMPPPSDPKAHVVDRKAAMAAKDSLETPDEARRRVAAGGTRPAHYVATPATGSEAKKERVASPHDKRMSSQSAQFPRAHSMSVSPPTATDKQTSLQVRFVLIATV